MPQLSVTTAELLGLVLESVLYGKHHVQRYARAADTPPVQAPTSYCLGRQCTCS